MITNRDCGKLNLPFFIHNANITYVMVISCAVFVDNVESGPHLSLAPLSIRHDCSTLRECSRSLERVDAEEDRLPSGHVEDGGAGVQRHQVLAVGAEGLVNLEGLPGVGASRGRGACRP